MPSLLVTGFTEGDESTQVHLGIVTTEERKLQRRGVPQEPYVGKRITDEEAWGRLSPSRRKTTKKGWQKS